MSFDTWCYRYAYWYPVRFVSWKSFAWQKFKKNATLLHFLMNKCSFVLGIGLILWVVAFLVLLKSRVSKRDVGCPFCVNDIRLNDFSPYLTDMRTISWSSKAKSLQTLWLRCVFHIYYISSCASCLWCSRTSACIMVAWVASPNSQVFFLYRISSCHVTRFYSSYAAHFYLLQLGFNFQVTFAFEWLAF